MKRKGIVRESYGFIGFHPQMICIQNNLIHQLNRTWPMQTVIISTSTTLYPDKDKHFDSETLSDLRFAQSPNPALESTSHVPTRSTYALTRCKIIFKPFWLSLKMIINTHRTLMSNNNFFVVGFGWVLSMKMKSILECVKE